MTHPHDNVINVVQVCTLHPAKGRATASSLRIALKLGRGIREDLQRQSNEDLNALDARLLTEDKRSGTGGVLYPLYLLSATTGMRRAEVAGLVWRSVDLDTARLTVSQ